MVVENESHVIFEGLNRGMKERTRDSASILPVPLTEFYVYYSVIRTGILKKVTEEDRNLI